MSVKYDELIRTTRPSAVLPSLRIVMRTSSLFEFTELAAFSHTQLTLGAVDEVIDIESTISPFSSFN